jgi:hypothetical protein
MNGAVNEDFLATIAAFIVGRRSVIDVLTLDRRWFNRGISEESISSFFVRCVVSPFVFNAGSRDTA